MTVTDDVAAPSRRGRVRAVLSSPATWVAVALPMALSPLLDRDEGASDLWWTTPLLFGLYLVLWLLPGFLLPAVLFTAWATGRYGLDAAQVFAVAGALTWYETLTVGVTYLVSAPPLAPVVVAFYVTSYAVYTGALGALVVDPAALHAPTVRRVGPVRRLGVAVVGGAVCWACFAGWGLVVL